MADRKPLASTFIGTIDEDKLPDIERVARKARSALQARRTPAELGLAVHPNLNNIVHRASAVDPYEARRAAQAQSFGEPASTPIHLIPPARSAGGVKIQQEKWLMNE